MEILDNQEVKGLTKKNYASALATNAMYMRIIMVNGTTVTEFRFFNQNKKKENMDNL